jgi:small subunit ribosomal protein S3
MGQKVHPESMRVGYIHDWKSNWFNERQFADYLNEDTEIRRHIVGRLSHAGLSDITIRKNATEVEVNIHTARPGIVIGKSGSEVDQLRRDLHRITHKQIKVNILEIKRPELDARLVAQSIAEQLQNRVAFRRAMKRALTSAMRSGAKGVKVQVSGRLGGAEMARTEGYSDGRVPLHTLRADIDYGFHEARTTFGRIGVKCWINKGEIMPEGYTGADLTIMDEPSPQAPERGGRDGRGRGGRGGRGGSRGQGRSGGGGQGARGPANGQGGRGPANGQGGRGPANGQGGRSQGGRSSGERRSGGSRPPRAPRAQGAPEPTTPIAPEPAGEPTTPIAPEPAGAPVSPPLPGHDVPSAGGAASPTPDGVPPSGGEG